jgi:hypothetical protein
VARRACAARVEDRGHENAPPRVMRRCHPAVIEAE